MTILLEFREKLKIFYSKHDMYIRPFIKCIVTFITLTTINANIGFMTRLTNPVLVIMVALASTFLPFNAVLVLAAIFMVAHFYAASLPVALVALAIILLMFLLYYRFSPKESYLVLLTPIGFMLKIPFILPLLGGLLGTPLSAFPIAFGVILYYLMYSVKQNASVINNSEASNMLQTYTYLIDNILNNKEMLVCILAFTVTILVVYLIRRLSIDYSWSIAIVLGAITNLLIMLVCDYMLNISYNILWLIIGICISVGLAFCVKFMAFHVDYTRTEHVQFEDDEYYYYVKAIPKISITSREKKVKRINPQKKMTKRTSLSLTEEIDLENELKDLK
ncbi:ABC transporter permease [Candidatus Galacturonibacter soehngenii]|uniref:ABC transporter permease n=1 Tax=Candidatus Galacturonatibacter soehngenii TaxID=2307010 RepID=A0A7V7QHG6_9FIRM|nr:ABC transporter permease [Candidatus Galacturonibacter soehngenii]KAB1434384.1 ABC transporter permease [Candidatus Galacturonibacter soehngenii]MBA4686727.1 ABC transporter permease [Candidatus Galacturonibacter soehngenii]